MKTEIVIDYENRLKKGMLNSDVEMLNEVLSDDLIFTNHFGQIMTKSDDINGHRSGFVKINAIKQSEQSIKI